MSDRKETRQREELPHYDAPAGGWGSLQSVARHLGQDRPDKGALDTLMRQNKPGGHMCTSCAWAKPPNPHVAEFCENGAKATLWDLTRDRCTPDFFARHTVEELKGFSDYELEMQGRLTHPMRYDPETDKYVETTWDAAFAGIGERLKALDPKSVVFYASGRASLETSYLYALFARLYGHNNLPDSSNMCHETTSVGLKEVTGSPVGTCVLSDFDHCDLILFFGQNTGTNSPRFLHPLRAAKKRGCRIVTFNPVREAGLVTFRDPQNPVEMLAGAETQISDRYLQVRPGGDIAALMGLCKRVLEIDGEQGGGVLDRTFMAQHTSGWPEFEKMVRDTPWPEIERASGLSQEDLAEVGEMYAESEKVIGIYGMGLTQHVHGSLNIAMLVNLLLMRGNIGREGAGISPVRGHSNVQGQRTVGISEKPDLVPLDKLEEMFGFTAPRDEGTTTVEAVKGVMDGTVKGFVSLGGNFARAIPDIGRADPAWAGLDINVQIATKLNRSHLLVGKETWLLPCLVRAEEDMQATGPQAVSMEDSLSHIHGSQGRRTPASKMLRSEPFIVAGIAKATLPGNPKVKWDDWVADYALVRDLIEETYPDKFENFNARLFEAGGFYKGNPARERQWQTETGRAIFTAPKTLSALGQDPGADSYTLVTLRSNDQFNTTIYGFDDRLRGLKTDRQVVLMNPEMIERAGLAEGQRVTLDCAVDDGHARTVAGLKVIAYDLPDGCVAAYYPETNPLIPLGYHDELSKTPAYKGVPVRIRG
ncbi:FdhF/YdeP family oxidoreductase [Limimaricola pyoseonensis]|uniref:Oxidoreductase alpha (Molybdopterin) subunit n=1 Tax=Limimaricola pyoseonensis TaxID=521013 RepID=A0A1G7IU47_9RHOB|nr:FdhF/YdeP family oxidoreductase [Limimaricola pyoseonensis]SDF16262.1 oxidoreductase alpha (molybdopterin) subunit [Limimaricola pyoseonensis]